MDVESTVPLTRRPVENPYNQELGPRHPYNIFKRCGIISASLYGLHSHFQVHEKIMHSPLIGHEWFKVGLAASVAILALKSYVELYQGKIRKKKINYENFKTSTHCIMVLLLLASVAFHKALWPEYGAKTLVIMTLVGFGICLQLALFVPTWVQNAVGAVVLTLFIQLYV